MTRTRLAMAVTALCLSAQAAGAACYADYKAKQDAPLRLHFSAGELTVSAQTQDVGEARIA